MVTLKWMEGQKPKPITQIVFALVFTAAGGLSLWYWGSPNPQHVVERREAAKLAAEKTAAENPVRSEGADGLSPAVPSTVSLERPDGLWPTRALDYARAWRQGRCDDVIATTQWMQDRLAYVRTREGGDSAEARAKQDLCAAMQERTPEGNQLTAEGVEDQYVFRSGATLDAVAVDEGRAGLEAPAKARVWLRVAFASKQKALNDVTGSPIQSLTVGLNLSADGMVLKAGVRGTAEIDWNSVSTDWPKEAE